MQAGYADGLRRLVAPDGIEILPIPLVRLQNLTVVEGRLPPGSYPVHYHYSIEQVTYVLEGNIVVSTWDDHKQMAAEVEVGPGGAIATAPGQTLAFENPGPVTARVLFITAPPYPPDDSDTRLIDTHRAATRDDLRHRAELELDRAGRLARTAREELRRLTPR